MMAITSVCLLVVPLNVRQVMVLGHKHSYTLQNSFFPFISLNCTFILDASVGSFHCSTLTVVNNIMRFLSGNSHRYLLFDVLN